MQESEQMDLAVHMAAMMARFEARCDRIEQRLNALTQQVPAQIDEHTERWLQTVSGQVESVARAGLEPPLAEGRRGIQGIAAEADQTVRTLQMTQRDVASIVRRVWIGAGVSLALSLAALVVTYEMLYGHYENRYATLKSQVDYLDAVNQADVAPCGNGRLCARIDGKAPPAGDKKQYRLVELRP